MLKITLPPAPQTIINLTGIVLLGIWFGWKAVIVGALLSFKVNTK